MRVKLGSHTRCLAVLISTKADYQLLLHSKYRSPHAHSTGPRFNACQQ